MVLEARTASATALLGNTCMRKTGFIILGTIAGILLTPPTVWLAVISAGGGHGHYVLARLFFPYTMLLTRLANDTITYPLMALALLQFPLYGAVVGLAVAKYRMAYAIVLLFVIHALAAVLCFSGLLGNFS